METRRMCPNCRAFITTDDKTCPYCDFTVGAKAVDRRSPQDLLGGLIPHERFTTVVLLLVNAGLYVAMVLHGMGTGGSNFENIDGLTAVNFGAKFGPLLQQGQWWRLVTAGFLHFGIMHILMNSWVLFDLGTQVEQSFGTARYLAFYFVSTITGFYASYLWSPVPSAGASAGIFGLVGVMIALGARDRSGYGAQIRRMYTQYAIYGLLFGILPLLLPGILGFRVDNAAHLGGLAGGFAMAYIAGTPRIQGPMEQIWKGAAIAAVVLTAIAFGFMARNLMAGGLQL